MALHAVVKACESNELAIGRYCRIVVRAVAVGQRFQCTIRDGHLVHLCVERIKLMIRMTIGGKHNGGAVWCPRVGAGAADAGTVVVVARGQLSRRAPVGRHDKQVIEAGLHVAGLVKPIGHLVDDLGRLSPGGALWRGRHAGDGLRVRRHKADKRKLLSIRRPGDGLRWELQIGQPGGLTGVHPSQIDLRTAVLIGHV